MTYSKKPKTIAELRRRADGYFKSKIHPVYDKNGEPVTDENGSAVMKIAEPFTLTGFALALGCESREELFSFEDEEMSRYIKMSVMRIEEYAEERLFSKEAFSGVKLFLSVNFERWRGSEESCDDSYELPEAVARWTV